MTAITVLLYSSCFQQDQHDLTKVTPTPTDYDRKPVLSSLPAVTKKFGLGLLMIVSADKINVDVDEVAAVRCGEV